MRKVSQKSGKFRIVNKYYFNSNEIKCILNESIDVFTLNPFNNEKRKINHSIKIKTKNSTKIGRHCLKLVNFSLFVKNKFVLKLFFLC